MQLRSCGWTRDRPNMSCDRALSHEAAEDDIECTSRSRMPLPTSADGSVRSPFTRTPEVRLFLLLPVPPACSGWDAPPLARKWNPLTSQHPSEAFMGKIRSQCHPRLGASCTGDSWGLWSGPDGPDGLSPPPHWWPMNRGPDRRRCAAPRSRGPDDPLGVPRPCDGAGMARGGPLPRASPGGRGLWAPPEAPVVMPPRATESSPATRSWVGMSEALAPREEGCWS
jgi:hypothetical protein